MKSGELLDLNDVVCRMRPFNRRYVGIRAIPVEAIVGSWNRVGDFDRDFRPRRPESAQRLRSLAKAFPEGAFPPILAHRLGEAHFVADGHHRVALARAMGVKMIDAQVIELRAHVPLPADADVAQVILLEQERIFLEESGLACAKPGIRIRGRRPADYVELLENVQVHGYHLMLERERAIAPCEIAADWYERVFLPAIRARREAGMNGHGATPEGNVFLDLHRRRRAAYPECGWVPLEEVAARAAREEAPYGIGGFFRRVLSRHKDEEDGAMNPDLITVLAAERAQKAQERAARARRARRGRAAARERRRRRPGFATWFQAMRKRIPGFANADADETACATC